MDDKERNTEESTDDNEKVGEQRMTATQIVPQEEKTQKWKRHQESKWT